MTNQLLKINNLHACIEGIEILKGVDLTINCGEIHAIMGPNGSGKSTLAKVIAGHPAYTITEGNILLNNVDIIDIEPEIRSHLGIFLAFQYPVELPGVNNVDFLRLAYNAKQKFNKQPEIDPLNFFSLINEKLKIVNMNAKFLERNVNEGFSGGEKKRNEILQMALLKAQLGILDETDSGLDIDALKTIGSSIKQMSNANNSLLLITHYKRLLDYIKPNFVHIMHDGYIKLTGDVNLAYQLEEKGYELLQLTH